MGLDQFIAIINEAQQLAKEFADKDVESSGIKHNRDLKARELRTIVTRFRFGMRYLFGSDSAQYGQAGGTLESARKPPRRTAKADSVTNTDTAPKA